MSDKMRNILTSQPVEASAPCRADMGGTLDISTFYYPLRHLNPCTFNIALGLRTRVRLRPCDEGMVRVSSEGIGSAEYPLDQAPFDHPLGLMFAIAAYFRAEGVHIEVDSASPPRSALGGSSVAAVALIGAFSSLFRKMGAYRDLYRREIAILAHALEECVAGVPCGLQDQLAAAYGGVNAWQWYGRVKEAVFEREVMIKKKRVADFEKHILVAYCGVPHVSADINGQWVRQFLNGRDRVRWAEIIRITQQFIGAIKAGNYGDAIDAMNRETAIRREMTPDVVDEIGAALVETALEKGCGARFTGAGGGGCIWALGETGNIDSLRAAWEKVLSEREEACLLDTGIDSDGLTLPIL
ncbi:galactokinase [Desulfonema ishimotonii]|uniref:Galactokinase n=1 Tax=Desulfonema ishimotonii TaxID=45657 RepID=A0A401G4P8_9BACT|nr:galactokinase [Desulfonema ishimotonii]GBC64115.1 galactokinase [Desulfonema ishimotonii]